MDSSYGTIDTDIYNLADTSSATDLLEEHSMLQSKTRYPFSVFFILSNEFCERFSYYGMRAILVLYLTRWLSFEESAATSIFHAFSMLCYLMPLFGAIIADGYLGKYRTILYMSCIYCLGNLVLSLTTLPPPNWIGPCLGLFLIACGTGGIKASVAPFGADQFGPGQEKWRNSFFSAFYFMINLGSMISILVTPTLRADVQCFGHDCYILAFGVPAILMFIALVMFIAGRKFYKKAPTSVNIVGKTCCCIYYGAKGRLFRSKYEEKKSHWLYYADDRYDNAFIEDVHGLVKLLLMFIPLPLFWALSDQQGSRWTLQAQHMDGNMGIFGYLKPDQIQALNPILVLTLIPLFDNVIYPLLDYCKVPNRPLQRMVFGLYISALAFVCAGLVQLKMDMSLYNNVLPKGKTGVTIVNTLPCRLTIKSPVFSGDINRLESTNLLLHDAGSYSAIATAVCPLDKQLQPSEASFTLHVDNSYRLVWYKSDDTLAMKQLFGQTDIPKNGNAALSVFSTALLDSDMTYLELRIVPSTNTLMITENVGTLFHVTQYNASEFVEMEPMEYRIYVLNLTIWQDTGLTINLDTPGMYMAFVSENNRQLDVTLYTDVRRNRVSMLWLIPQFVLITVGEVLFSISGLSFAYSQAPSSLKSVVQAIWLLTVSFGDLMVIIVANIHAIPSQMAEFFLFACLMFIDTIIFMVMAINYKYKLDSLSYTVLKEDTTSDTHKNTAIDNKGSVTELLPLHAQSSIIAIGK